jgi:carboxypeptidase PM20D1
MIRTLKFLAIALTALVLIVLINTWRLPALPEPQGDKLAAPENLDAASERLSAAIRIPTISLGFAKPPGGDQFPALHALLAKSFPLTHATLTREIVGEGSLLYTWPGSDATLAPVLITAHQDVVPIEPGTEGGWTHPPFGGVIADGYVWGRGTMDDKHRLMATFEAVEYLLTQGHTPRRTVLLAFGHDEEIGGLLGAKKIADLLESRKVRAQFALDEGSAILDGVVPGANRPIAQIGVAEKGYMSLELTATGLGGHSSMPPANTAVGKLGRAIAALEANQMPATLDGPGGDALRAIAPALPFAQRIALANTWLFGPLLKSQLAKVGNTNALIRSTTAPTMISGGIKENVLPTQAKAIVNFRILPGDTADSVKAHVTRTINDPDITLTDYLKAPAEATPVADTRNPGYALISDTARRIEPSALVVPSLVIAGTDSKHWSRVSDAAFRFTPARIGPDELKRFHATNERIAISNYGEIISFYRELITQSTK